MNHDRTRPTLVLASSSPRRAMLLKQLELYDIVVDPSGADESVSPGLTPAETVAQLALRKGVDVAARHASGLIVAADTVVAFRGQIFNKPRDGNEARAMLQTLSGQTHTVYTGLYMRNSRTGETVTTVERAEVTFRPITARELDWYVATGEPLDKAGAYGAQEKGCLFIEKINGDYTCVVGLPMCRLGRWLLTQR